MKIAILSGKGGTGKTTVSTNLALTLGMNYVDCDVEEPNGHIFLKPEIDKKKAVGIPVPKIDRDICTLCGKCVQACQFNALAKSLDSIMLFDELCHGCGACGIVCPVDAITEVDRTVGYASIGKYADNIFMSGKLNIKEPMAVPIIKYLKDNIPKEGDTLIDCSPGTSCTVVEAVEDTDFALLVTEPTRFGLHDLKLAISLVRDMKIPYGVLINRSHGDKNLVVDYCEEESISIIGEIPFSRKAAELYSKGLLLNSDDEFKKIFEDIGVILLNEINK